MATRVFTEEVLELQDGTNAIVRPLNLKRLRKFMDVVEEFQKAEDEITQMEIMVRACAIALGQKNPDLENDNDRLEEILDVPTMWRIFEVAGGIKMSDPNVQKAAEEFLGRT